MMATPRMMTHETIQISQNRFHMAGHSLKKCDSSTSLIVEAHCMLYPVKWASLRGSSVVCFWTFVLHGESTYSAVVRCHDRPQKKKKKNTTHCKSQLKWIEPRDTWGELTLKLLIRAFPSEFVFSRYWKMAEEMFERPEKMTIQVKKTCHDSR